MTEPVGRRTGPTGDDLIFSTDAERAARRAVNLPKMIAAARAKKPNTEPGLAWDQQG